jgi:hypothetical protein
MSCSSAVGDAGLPSALSFRLGASQSALRALNDQVSFKLGDRIQAPTETLAELIQAPVAE